jgi:AcrR family transcriptional regulator
MTDTLDRRQRVRQATIEEIKATAREQMAGSGAAGLSLGAIARAMGMTPPALYRYFRNRHALVIALIVDAYDAQAGALEGYREGLKPDDFEGQFLTLMRAYRQWALEHREDYALMHGVPLTRPDLSDEQIQQIQRSTMRNLRVIVQLFRTAHDANRLTIPRQYQPRQYQEPLPAARQALEGIRLALQDESLPLGIIALSFLTWLQVHGLVWQELHGHLPKFLFGSGDLYEMELRVMAERLGLAAVAERAELDGTARA